MSHCVPLTRWWAGEWQPCSRSCGPEGLSRRAVFCIRSIGLDEQRALEPSACEHLPRPLAETPCNRYITCPSTWGVGNWSQVSAELKGDLPPVLPLPGILTEVGGSLGGIPGTTLFSEPWGSGVHWHAVTISYHLALSMAIDV